MTGRVLERLNVRIPDYPEKSHPFSRSEPVFYRLDTLGDTAEGQTNRTEFFQKVFVGLYWYLARPVPYAFETMSGDIRSMDAGCMKFLHNRNPPDIHFERDGQGYIVAARPAERLLELYAQMRSRLIADVSVGNP